MKADDVNKFKGQLKTALSDWADNKIEELLPARPTARTFIKRAVNNLLTKEDAKINGWVDTAFLFIADEKGVVDSDTLVDTAADLFKEMEKKEYAVMGMTFTIGKGELIVNLPTNVLLDMLVGNLSSVTFTTDDLLEFKNYLN